MDLALFDFDGTITFKDTFVPFLRFAVDRRRQTAGKFVLSPFVAGYKLGMLSASAVRERAATFGFRGKLERDVRHAGVAYARNFLPGMIRRTALERIHHHKSAGDIVVVVSASLDVYLDEWCRSLDVDVICTELNSSNG